MGKLHGNLHCTPPLPILHSWEAVCQSRKTVRQFNRFTTVLQTLEFMQVSPFSSTVTKGHFSWYAFLKVWKLLLLSKHRFARVQSTGSATRTWNVFTNGALILKMYSACSFTAQMFSLRNFRETSSALCHSHMCRALLKANLHICSSRMRNASRSDFHKFWYKSFGNLGKIRKAEFVCSCFH